MPGKTKLALVNAQTGEVKYVDHGLKDPADKSDKPRERDVRFFALRWSEDGAKSRQDGSALLITKTWIMRLDPVTAKVTVWIVCVMMRGSVAAVDLGQMQ